MTPHSIATTSARPLGAHLRRALVASAILLGVARPATAQQTAYPSALNQQRDVHADLDTADIKRSGPRYGVIWLSQGIVDSVKTHYKNQPVNATTSLFGWEFQSQLLDNPKGFAPVTNLILGVAGLDQGLLLPSATWLVGMRSRDDFEFGIGPNLSLLGPALAIGAGMTLHSGKLNIPFDVAYVSSKVGPRYSFTTGFNVLK